MEVSIRPNVANWVGTLFAAIPGSSVSSTPPLSAPNGAPSGSEEEIKFLFLFLLSKYLNFFIFFKIFYSNILIFYFYSKTFKWGASPESQPIATSVILRPFIDLSLTQSRGIVFHSLPPNIAFSAS